MTDKTETLPATVVESSPVVLANQARDVAKVCREIVLKRSCQIQGKKYVQAEGWEAIAAAHGCHVSAGETKRVYENGEHIGWSAMATIRKSDGTIIGTGEGFVGKDEKTWSKRAEYACRAMASTRAISRASRAIFAHVVVLMDAGLETTPAEEMYEVSEPPKKSNSAKLANEIGDLCKKLKWDEKKFIEYIEYETGKKNWKSLTTDEKELIYISIKTIADQKDESH